MKKLVWYSRMYGQRWALVQHIGGDGQGFNLIWRRQGRVDQQSTYGIVDGMKNALHLAILWRGIWA